MPQEKDANNASARTGKSVIGGYEIEAKLGQGAMGSVFKARQTSLDRVVALKILPQNIAQDATYIERFQREARASGKLNHQHIVQGIDVGFDEKRKLWFFAMELVDGPSLKDVLKKDGKLPEERVREIAKAMAEALRYAQRHGFVHRDIKPDNILITNDGVPKLADLGLAKRIEGDDASLTQDGKAVGTPYYMSPEQVRGLADQIDTRSDIYALGATLFHLVTGEPPFTGNSGAEIMTHHLTQKIPLAHRRDSGVSEGLSRLLHQMMQKEQDKRPASPDELLDALDDLESGRPPQRDRNISRGRTTGPRTAVSSRRTTGPRMPVGARSAEWGARPAGTGDDRAEAKRSPYVVPVLVGVGVVMLLGVGFLAFGGKSKPTTARAKNRPAKRDKIGSVVKKDLPPSKENVAGLEAGETKRAAWERDWQAARDFASGNPDALNEQRQRYAQLLSAAKDLPHAASLTAKVEAVLKRLDAKRQEQARETWSDVCKRAKQAAESGDFDTALKLAVQVPANSDDRIKQASADLIAELRGDAEGAATKAITAVETAIQSKDWTASEAALKRASALKYAALTPRLAQQREKLKAAREAAKGEAEKLAQAALKRWQEVLRNYDAAALEKRDLDGARAVASKAATDALLKALSDNVKALQAVSGTFEDMKKRERTALAKMVGKKVRWTVMGQEIKGTVSELKGDKVFVKTGQMDLPVRLSDLPKKDRESFVPKFEPRTNAERVAAAILRLAKPAQDWRAAQAFLKAAAAFPLTKHYLDHVDRLRLGEREFNAAQAWKALAKKCAGDLQMDRAKQLLAEAEAYKTEHGETAFAKKNAAEIAECINRLRRAAGDSLTKGLVAHWAFDETEGDQAKDISGKGNHLRIHGATRSKGWGGNALKFDGKDDYAEAAHSSSLSVAGKFSIALRVKYNGGHRHPFLLGKGIAWGSGNYAIRVREGRIGVRWNNVGDKGFWSSAKPGGKQWTSVIAIGDVGHATEPFVRMYVDGKEVGSYTVPDFRIDRRPRPNKLPFFVGGSPPQDLKNGKGEIFKGQCFANAELDDIRIYKRILSPEEIALLVKLK